MPRRLCVSLLLIAALQTGLNAQPKAGPDKDPNWLLPLEETDPDPNLPTLEQVVGYPRARRISSHAEIERYLHALAEAAPDRAKLVRYGNTYERKSLYYLVISSPANMKRLDELVVIIDPLQNPDGRDRFVHSFRWSSVLFPDFSTTCWRLLQSWITMIPAGAYPIRRQAPMSHRQHEPRKGCQGCCLCPKLIRA